MIKYIGFKVSSLIILVFFSTWPIVLSVVKTDKGDNWGISEEVLSDIITPSVVSESLPEKIRIPGFKLNEELTIQYTLDSDLEAEADRLFKRYNPDYGVFVAIDPATGHILAMTDSSRDGVEYGNLSLMNTFPAASISKIITTVAAIEEGEANHNTIIPFNGKSTSLYKKQIFNHKNNKWTRKPTLSESFAKSVNATFGRLGAVHLGGQKMLDWAERLGFNSRFASDIEFDNGVVDLDVNDAWQVAEMASGYTRRNTLSPLHAAVLASTAVNGGKLIAPVLVSSVTGPNGIPLYVHEDPAVSQAMKASTANQLKKMMMATVKKGSARKSFHRFHRGPLADISVGGKTGSLSGLHPKGKYDWFVGFAERQGQQIAFAALCINKEKWYVKSARFARLMLEYYFSRKQPA